MAKPFDNAAKQLVETYPDDWIKLANLSGGPTEIIAADLSAINADADRVLRVGGSSPYLAHFEFQTTYDADMPERMLHYNVLLRYRHRLPVQSSLGAFSPRCRRPQSFGRRVWNIKPKTGILNLAMKPCACGKWPRKRFCKAGWEPCRLRR